MHIRMQQKNGRLCLGLALLCVALAGSVPSLARGAARDDPIRVGRLSAPTDSKVAIVVGGRRLLGARFEVMRGRRVVLRGRLRSAPGPSSPWRDAYRANLSRVHRPGVYRVRVGGHRSRPWRVAKGGSGKLIRLVLDFFRANRDGAEPALLHGSSHLNDAIVDGGPYAGVHFDLTGGWMDAGDMLHFTQTTAYATMVLEAAARLDPAHRAALDHEANVGVRWLVKAHPAPDLFVTQIGDVRDHNRNFSNPALDDSSGLPGIAHRSAYHWGTGVGGDIGGKVAAALAMAATRTHGSARASLLALAREWFAAGRESGQPTPAIPGAGDFYVVSSWQDSIAAGAAALYRATGESQYLRDARHALARSSQAPVLSYSNAAPLAAADICGDLGAAPLGGAAARRQGCRFLRHNAGDAISRAHHNPFGIAGPFAWGTTSSISAGGAIAALSHNRGGRAVAAGVRDYLLGRNPWGSSFIAGTGPSAPQEVSSWASVFGPGQPIGAVVGGPAPRSIVEDQGFRPGGPLEPFDGNVVYEDDTRDYVTSEPALDYASNTILLFASLFK